MAPRSAPETILNNNSPPAKIRYVQKSTIKGKNFWYVDPEEVSIAWRNVAVFGIGHVLYLISFFVFYYYFTIKIFLWSELVTIVIKV